MVDGFTTADDSQAAPLPTVALLVWGILYDEDFLDLIGVSLEAFATDMTGGYLFNYVEALRFAGIRTVVVLVARQVNRPTRLIHRATGATILALPASPLHRPFRWLARNRRAKRVLDHFPWASAICRRHRRYVVRSALPLLGREPLPI